MGRSDQGIALIIVMISIFVLSVLAGGFAYSMKVETKLARNSDSETELEWLGRSAVECARWELAEQLKIAQEPFDSMEQVWAGGSGGLAVSNSPLADFKHEITSKNGSATWTIVDLERKANINLANEALLNQAMIVMGVDAGSTTEIVSSILDWLDTDEKTHIQGAESDYYQGLRPPYFAKDGPMDDITELLFIKGITPEIYWGTSSSNHVPGAIQNQLASRTGSRFDPNVISYPVGLADLFTPMSSGKININTASAYVLQLIPGVDPMAAEGIVSARAGEDDGSGLVGPYRNVQQITRVPEVNLMVARQIQQFCDVRSRTFEVHVDAQVNSYHREFIAVIGRNNPRDVQVLSFYWK